MWSNEMVPYKSEKLFLRWLFFIEKGAVRILQKNISIMIKNDWDMIIWIEKIKKSYFWENQVSYFKYHF